MRPRFWILIVGPAIILGIAGSIVLGVFGLSIALIYVVSSLIGAGLYRITKQSGLSSFLASAITFGAFFMWVESTSYDGTAKAATLVVGLPFVVLPALVFGLGVGQK
jgi:hypothetical protein